MLSWAVRSTIPVAVSRLFWDVLSDAVDLETHRDYVIERVMSRGGWEAMKWLRTTYPQATLASFIERKGSRLAPRELAYWALVAGATVDVRPGGARPPWAGP
jgi:hypothetical protein